MSYETDYWWSLLGDMLRGARSILREARSNWVVVLLVLAAIVGVTAFLADAGSDDTYTKADCIRQWRDVGVFADAEELCAGG